MFVPLNQEVSELNADGNINGEGTPAPIRNRKSGVHFSCACTHAAKNESAVLACQVRSKAQAAGAVEDRRKWNRSDHRVAEATKPSIG